MKRTLEEKCSTGETYAFWISRIRRHMMQFAAIAVKQQNLKKIVGML